MPIPGAVFSRKVAAPNGVRDGKGTYRTGTAGYPVVFAGGQTSHPPFIWTTMGVPVLGGVPSSSRHFLEVMLMSSPGTRGQGVGSRNPDVSPHVVAAKQFAKRQREETASRHMVNFDPGVGNRTCQLNSLGKSTRESYPDCQKQALCLSVPTMVLRFLGGAAHVARLAVAMSRAVQFSQFWSLEKCDFRAENWVLA